MSSSLRVGCLLSVGAAFWAAAFLIPFKAAAELLPRETAVLGMLLSAAVLNSLLDGGLCVLRGNRQDSRSSTTLWVALVMALCAAIGNLGMANSLFWVAPAVSSVVIQLQVVLVPLGEWAGFGQRPGRMLWIGAVLGLAGFVIMQLPAFFETGDMAAADAVFKGSLWALLGAGSFGLMLLVTRQRIGNIDPMRVNTLRLWLGAGLMCLWPGQFSALAAMDWRAWALCAAAGACGPIFSRLLLMRSARYLPASQTKLFTLVSPLFAMGLGLLFFGVLPGLMSCLGGLVILVGVALPLLSAWRSARQAGRYPVAAGPSAGS